jgi:hypothetical protein
VWVLLLGELLGHGEGEPLKMPVRVGMALGLSERLALLLGVGQGRALIEGERVVLAQGEAEALRRALLLPLLLPTPLLLTLAEAQLAVVLVVRLG